MEPKKAEYVRATTPAVQPYVDIYRKHRFASLRRDFRIVWRTDEVPVANSRIETEELSDQTTDIASDVFVRASSPYWDWRTEEEGGAAALLTHSKKKETAEPDGLSR